MRLIKCLSIIMLVIGCVQPPSVQAYSPVLTETVQNTNNTNKRWTFMSIRHSWDSIEYNQNNILTTEGIKAIVSNSNLSESNNFKPSGVFQQSGKTNITIEKDFEVLVPTDLIVIDINNANYTKWLESLNTAYTAEANIPANQLAQKDTSNVKWNTIQGDSELNTDANMSRFIEALQYNNQTGKVTVKESSIQGEGETAFWINNDGFESIVLRWFLEYTFRQNIVQSLLQNKWSN